MTRFSLSVSCFLFCVIGVAFATEYEEHGHDDHHHEHPDGADTYAFDHEVFLGSKRLAAEFQMLDADEAKDKLLLVAHEMDSNKDGMLSKEELVAALSKNFLSLDQEEALEKMHTTDENHDNFVDWAEYVKNTYNTNVKTLDDLVANASAHSDPVVKSTVRTYRNDYLRFQLADKDHDGKLSLVEFTAFSHPYDFEHMLPAEVKQTIDSYDTDEDGKISLTEFLREDASGGDPEWKKQEETRFRNELDKNKDGFLDTDEVRHWISPTLQSSSIDEASHLMRLVDADEDGLMSQEELVNSYNILVGSSPDDDDDDDDDTDHDEL